ncbi:MAG: hypothetical protein ACYCVB_13380 [Bacilli bacterium]
MVNPRDPIRRILAAQLILLLLQFLLGVAVNLWVIIPATHTGAHPNNYFAGLVQGITWALLHANGFLQLHIAVGMALWILSLLLVVWAIRLRDREWIIATLLAWVGLTGASFNGGSFLIEGGMNISSFLMSVGMALAVGSYVWSWGMIQRLYETAKESRK